MFSRQKIVILIGRSASLLLIYDNMSVKKRFLIKDLEPDIELLKDELLKFKKAPIYLIIDSQNQVYKRKSYPPINHGDLKKLIEQDLLIEASLVGGKNDNLIKDYIILNHKESKVDKNFRQSSILILSPESLKLSGWINFIDELPNNILGTHILSIELFSWCKFLEIKPINTKISATDRLKSIVNKAKQKPQHKVDSITIFVINTKISGVLHIAESNMGVIFRRSVDYDFSHIDFLSYYQRDLYGTIEYAKRFFENTPLSIKVINVMPQELIDSITSSPEDFGVDFECVSYTPYDMANKLGCSSLVDKDAKFSDAIIADFFAKGHIVKSLELPSNKKNAKLYATSCALSYISCLLITLIVLGAFISLFKLSNSFDLLEVLEIKKIMNVVSPDKSKKLPQEESMKEPENQKIVELSKVDEVLSVAEVEIADIYYDLGFLKSLDVKLKKFSYRSELNQTNPNPGSTAYNVEFSGELINKSGDIEDLFRKFDILVAELKKYAHGADLKYSDIPKNVDFAKKYYDFQMDVKINKKSK